MVCTLPLWSDLDTRLIDSLSVSVCYWIVISELACFVMGYRAGALSSKNYVATSIINFFINLALFFTMLPILSCYKNSSQTVVF